MCTVVFCFPVDIILTFFLLLYGVYICAFEIFYYLTMQEVFPFFFLVVIVVGESCVPWALESVEYQLLSS